MGETHKFFVWGIRQQYRFWRQMRGGVGPFLAIYLQATRHWDPASIGVALSAAGLTGVIAHAPAGALVDRLRHKRELVALAALLMAVGCLAILWFPSVPGVIAAQALVGIVGAVFLPALAGISLGLVGYKSRMEFCRTSTDDPL